MRKGEMADVIAHPCNPKRVVQLWITFGGLILLRTLASGLDKTRFCKTETRPRPGLIEILRLRRDRDFYKMIFRDRDNTETKNLDREMREIENETRIS